MITGLPASFGDLTSILHLDLSCNKISLTNIPKSFFGNEMELERLYLSDNNIPELTDDFTELVNLKVLAMR
jgi:Leucine-rich repeat (LRR) protein